MPSVSDINAHPAQKLSRLRVSPGTISGVPELDCESSLRLLTAQLLDWGSFPVDSLSPLDSLSGTDVCNSPVQGTVHVTPDIPLHCPIPVRGNSPQFVQFDCLPDEDEDLSFPPYTRSRRSRKRRRERDGSDGMPSNQVYVAGLPTDGGIYDRLMGVGLITLPHGESPRAI
ncbi:hypothetical protein BD410DRAFT_782367 [Rickenella mellea]|uniref:Uncharacterized protein n=1 Tax=Rickenella mellea TaxID=50990 RepID=A0A4Y7QJ49_9AGAM|nr:hypothetical protein BD410DRAFT_782367 [Rickenella mellea]